MSKFKITIILNRTSNDTFFYKEEKYQLEYFNRNGKSYKDDIVFSRNKIFIVGSRNKKMSKEALETINSTYYVEIIKCLLFVYFKEGGFNIESISMEQDENELCSYNEDTIKQNFNQLLDSNFFLDFSQLFELPKIESDVLMNSLMGIVIALSEEASSFDHAWRAFNNLIRWKYDKGGSNSKTDFSLLKETREDLEKNPEKFKRILDFSSRFIDEAYLEERLLNQMILNNYKSGANESKNVKAFFTDFTDGSVCKVLKKKVECKKKILKENNLLNEVNNHLDKYINKGDSKEIDKARIIVLKYCYFLRCKYFHGEKIPVNFVIENENYEELRRMVIPLVNICLDLIETNFL